MGKRTTGFKKQDRNYYRTIDPRAVRALLPHVDKAIPFFEPCAGAGDLADYLVAAGLTCFTMYDIEPQRADIHKRNALDVDLIEKGQYITNPPFDRAMLEPLLQHWLKHPVPTWLLLPADYMHNLWMGLWMKQCTDIVSIGRLNWFAPEEGGEAVSSVDNYAWYRFERDPFGPTKFWGRVAKP